MEPLVCLHWWEEGWAGLPRSSYGWGLQRETGQGGLNGNGGGLPASLMIKGGCDTHESHKTRIHPEALYCYCPGYTECCHCADTLLDFSTGASMKVSITPGETLS